MRDILPPLHACPLPPGRLQPKKRVANPPQTRPTLEALKRRRTQYLLIFLTCYIPIMNIERLATLLVIPHLIAIAYLTTTSNHKTRYDTTANDTHPSNCYCTR